MAKATCYLQVEPVWERWTNFDGDHPLRDIKVVGLTKKRPPKIRGVAVKLTLSIPDGAFKPLAPEVVIDIPEAALDYEPKVEVNLPDREEADHG